MEPEGENDSSIGGINPSGVVSSADATFNPRHELLPLVEAHEPRSGPFGDVRRELPEGFRTGMARADGAW